MTPELVKYELGKLELILTNKVEQTKSKIKAKNRVVSNLLDIGFYKKSENIFSLHIKVKDMSYLVFTIKFISRSVDITETHIIVVDGAEVLSSSVGQGFSLFSVRYSKVLDVIYQRVLELEKEFEDDV